MLASLYRIRRFVVLDEKRPISEHSGMFVQSARIVEQRHQNPAKQLTFRGLEKNKTTINLAKMNLAVHGLEGDIQQALTYYEDPLNLLKKCNFVMANPPFNVDEVDADKVKNDPRLPFGLPGVTQSKGKNGDAKGKGRVQNANYLWIQYFYSYLNDKGRAGFVMSSQASSASGEQAKVRQKLIETGDVDIMVAVRGNFFYTRPVPCELWFLNRAKQKEHRDKILMFDAREVYRKVTRKIYDFSPEQIHNLLSIIWLYRGQHDRFRGLVADHLNNARAEANNCPALLQAFSKSTTVLHELMRPFVDKLTEDGEHTEPERELEDALTIFAQDATTFGKEIGHWPVAEGKQTPKALVKATGDAAPLADKSRDLARQADHLYKLLTRLLDVCENELDAKKHDDWNSREITRARKSSDEARHGLVEQLRRTRYFQRHAAWLVERFPNAELIDVPGLVKLVSKNEIEKNDWSLTPGRYVGIAPEEVDQDFDFEDAIKDIHVELEGLNEEATMLGATISKHFKDLIG
jgi:type I restriction enzyme M protein